MGNLTKLTVEHNGLKQEDAWFLDHITVTEVRGGRGEGGGGGEGGGQRKWHFPCKQWLSLHHSDCQVSHFRHTLSMCWRPSCPRLSSQMFRERGREKLLADVVCKLVTNCLAGL